MKHPPMRFTKTKLGEGHADSDGGGGRSARMAAAATAAAAERPWVTRRKTRPVAVLIPFQSQSSAGAARAATTSGVGSGTCFPFPEQRRGPPEATVGGAGWSRGARPHSSTGRETHAIITELISAAGPKKAVNPARGQAQPPLGGIFPAGTGSSRPGSSPVVARGGARPGDRGGRTVSPRRLVAGGGARGGGGPRTKLPMPTVSLSLRNSKPPDLGGPSPRHRITVAGGSWEHRPV